MNEYHELAKAKGWHDGQLPPTPERVDEMVMLIVTEVAELIEELRVTQLDKLSERKFREDGKPIGAWAELADILIRSWDLIGALELNNELDEFYILPKRKRPKTTGQAIGWWRRDVAYLTGLMAENGFTNLESGLSNIISSVYEFAQHVGINMADAVEAKHEHNKTRPDRHGGKLA